MPSDNTTRASSKQATPAKGFVLLVWPSAMRQLALPASGSVVLGRGSDADLRIDDESLSRKHARFTVSGNRVTVEDLKSRNGTKIGGVSITTPTELSLGAVAELGDVVVALHRGELAAPVALPDTVVLDPRMKELYQLVDVIAPSDVSVLVLGETGTGKEVFSRAIHLRSKRRERELLSLSCAALPETTLEAELFGYERGAFTGATQAKPGLFETADRGTVFLDEIGELPLATQAKLLRFLETGETMRLGSVKPRTLDVRIVSATNRDLDAEVAAKTFRADLFFRLNGISVTLPPLRERRSEIGPLATMFLQRAAAKAGKSVALTKEATAALTAHAWPGNIRELRNVVERAVLVAGSKIQVGDLDLTSPGVQPTTRSGLRSEIEDIERKRIVEALAASNGNQSEAARALGIARGTLLVKLDQFGIPRPRKR